MSPYSYLFIFVFIYLFIQLTVDSSPAILVVFIINSLLFIYFENYSAVYRD